MSSGQKQYRDGRYSIKVNGYAEKITVNLNKTVIINSARRKNLKGTVTKEMKGYIWIAYETTDKKKGNIRIRKFGNPQTTYKFVG